MRSTWWLVVVALLVGSGCGDDGNNTPADAGPGQDTRLGTQCDDGIDNDGDNKTDYPADPGCIAPNADDETDDCPDGALCPQCGNGVDDDNNGATDYPDDPGCESASDPTEVLVSPVACGATLMIKDLPATGTDTGMLDGTGPASTSQIMSPCGGGGGALAIAYRLILTQPTVIRASTAGSTFDTVLDLRSAMCSDAGSEVACHDDVSIDIETSTLTHSLPAGVFYLIVQGSDTSETGNYTLTVEKFAGEGVTCTDTSECGPTLVCRTPLGGASMVCTKPQCGDDLDDDQDGKGDYPTDPGCESPDDNDETDPTPLPACADGIDNDDDDDIDYPMDTSCTSAAGNSESCAGEEDPVGNLTIGTTTGNLVGAHDNYDLECDSSFGGGVEMMYTLTVPEMQSLTIDTDTSVMDTVLSLLPSTCMEPNLGCEDGGGSTNGASLITVDNLAAGTYLVVVSSWDGSPTSSYPPGPFTINVSGTIADGASCEGPLALAGAIECAAASTCAGLAGSRVCQPPQCSDGVDNDTPSDGAIDYPFDPGCDTPTDNDETDPAVAPVCSNMVDDDMDSTMDFPGDYGCSSAAGTSEVFCAIETDPPVLVTTTPMLGTTTGKTNDFTLHSCSYMNDSSGEDIVFALSLPVPVVTLVLGTEDSAAIDTQLAVRDAQCGLELGCDEDSASNNNSLLTLTNVRAGNYSVIVDGYNETDGDITLDIVGTVAPGTDCTSTLFTTGVLVCPSGTSCTGTPMRCQ